MAENNRKVWSSEGGRVQGDRGKRSVEPGGDGRVRIRRETKGRRGKTVTVISGLALAPAELDELAADLKKRCGVGGTMGRPLVQPRA